MLVGSKYKLDEDLYTDDEIKLSKLQLKIEANKSRQSIEQLRNSYTMPEVKETRMHRALALVAVATASPMPAAAAMASDGAPTACSCAVP